MTRPGLSLVFLAALVGCNADVQMVLAPVEGCESACGTADMSCVRYVGVVAVGATPDQFTAVCTKVEPGTIRSLCDHDLDNQFDLQLPPGLTSVEVQGFASELGCGATTAFGGHTTFQPNENAAELRLPMQCNLDCSTYAERAYDVQLVDLDTLATEARCAPPADVQGFDLAVGMTQDFRRYTPSPFFNVGFEPFDAVAMESAPSASGSVRLSGSSYGSGDVRGRCVSLDVFGAATWNTNCIAPAPSINACASASAIEMPWVSPALSLRVEAMLTGVREFGWYYVGVVWDAQARRPVVGARIADLPEGATAYYVDRAGDRLVVRPGDATGATGMVIVVGDMVGPVTVEATGYVAQTAVVAVTSHNPSAGVVTLTRAAP